MTFGDGQLDLSGYVLAGGASSRMGADKALLRLRGRTLVEHALGLLRSAGLDAKIAASRTDLEAYAPVVEDRRAGCGPLSGIEAGLRDIESGYGVFVPVDAPLLPAALLRHMMERVAITGALITMPRFQGREQPLCAIYHRDLLPAVTHALDDGDGKVMRVVRRAALARGGEAAIDIFDVEAALAARGEFAGWPQPPHAAFLNCNYPEDLLAADAGAGGLFVE